MKPQPPIENLRIPEQATQQSPAVPLNPKESRQAKVQAVLKAFESEHWANADISD